MSLYREVHGALSQVHYSQAYILVVPVFSLSFHLQKKADQLKTKEGDKEGIAAVIGVVSMVESTRWQTLR